MKLPHWLWLQARLALRLRPCKVYSTEIATGYLPRAASWKTSLLIPLLCGHSAWNQLPLLHYSLLTIIIAPRHSRHGPEPHCTRRYTNTEQPLLPPSPHSTTHARYRAAGTATDKRQINRSTLKVVATLANKSQEIQNLQVKIILLIVKQRKLHYCPHGWLTI